MSTDILWRLLIAVYDLSENLSDTMTLGAGIIWCGAD